MIYKLKYYFSNYVFYPIYLLKYYQNGKNTIHLDDKLIFSQGNKRFVYFFPNDNSKCIKIVKKKNFYNDYIFNNNIEEFRFHLLNNYDRCISKNFGIVNTNKGIGYVYEIIRDYNNNISLPLGKYIDTVLSKKNNDYKKLFKQEYANFYLRFLNKYYHIYTSLTNCVVQQTDKDNYRFVIIDGFSYDSLDFKLKKKSYCKKIVSKEIKKIFRNI